MHCERRLQIYRVKKIGNDFELSGVAFRPASPYDGLLVLVVSYYSTCNKTVKSLSVKYRFTQLETQSRFTVIVDTKFHIHSEQSGEHFLSPV